MRARFVLAPQAAADLVEIWSYVEGTAASQWRTELNPSFGTGSHFWLVHPVPDIGAEILPMRSEVFPGLLLPHRLPAQDEAPANRFNTSRSPRSGRNPQGSFMSVAHQFPSSFSGPGHLGTVACANLAGRP